MALTSAERKQLANKLDSLLAEAEKQPGSMAHQYGHLRGAIKCLAAAIEAGTFPEKSEVK